MYTPFEHQGSIEIATHAKLDKIIIEESDVTIQYLEGYEIEGEFISLGASHISVTPEVYGSYETPKDALIATLNKQNESEIAIQ
jgi:hypothetical protein